MAARSTLADFVLQEKVGSGSFGVVWRATRRLDGRAYALKEIDLHGMSKKQEQEECIRETQILSEFDSDYIVKFWDSFLEKGRLYIVMEFAGGGNVHELLQRAAGPLPEEVIWKLLIQMLLGLSDMHRRKVLHRDFKTLNVFLDAAGNAKLGDLGVAKILSTQTAFARTVVGTPYYLSPELCEDKPYNDKSDIWAFGVTLYELCTRRHPFDADNQGALVLKILKGGRS
ncbi:MAG: kinase-like domain-containing protein [Monoraphidium minutum]|nr:MAG: kinase-like domain-containing protein [Monoraphidium minutum]